MAEDPLTVLRTYNMDGKEIITENGRVVFGDLSWPKTANTNFLAYGSGKDGVPKQYYTLECLLYLLRNRTVKHPEYVRQAVAQNMPVIRRPNRKELLAYLDGESSTAASIDRSAPLETPTRVKRSAVDDAQESVAKKPRAVDTNVEDTAQVQRVGQPLATRSDDDDGESAAVDVNNVK